MFSRIFSKSNDADKSEAPAKSVFIQKIEDIPEIFADRINEIILNEELYKAAAFLGGEFIIEYIDDKTYTCHCKFYFQGKDDSTYDLETKKQRLDIARLSDTARQDLQTQKIIKFEIPEPTEEIRRTYKLVKI